MYTDFVQAVNFLITLSLSYLDIARIVGYAKNVNMSYVKNGQD